jgi:hypothetical protein
VRTRGGQSDFRIDSHGHSQVGDFSFYRQRSFVWRQIKFTDLLCESGPGDGCAADGEVTCFELDLKLSKAQEGEEDKKKRDGDLYR